MGLFDSLKFIKPKIGVSMCRRSMGELLSSKQTKIKKSTL